MCKSMIISSSVLSINTGVPQGSIVRPLLFNIFVNDITMSSDTFKVLEKCTKKLIGHSRLAFNNHESNIDC